MGDRARVGVIVLLAGAACSPGPDGDRSDASAADAAAGCADGVQNGTETDVDCGGTCMACAIGGRCTVASDCMSSSCSTVCLAPTCSDGIRNGTETGLDCGGSCPITYSGEGCVTGTGGSMVCSSYTSGTRFHVVVTWNAAGGNGFVDYVTTYHGVDEFNAAGELAGGAINVCTSGPVTQEFDLPLGGGYTWKIWHADCVRTDACSGCGSDIVTDEGGPFGVYADCG
jgi:hypothetical protein